MQPQHQNNDLYKFPTQRGKGIFATLLFHVIVGGLLVVFGFHTPLPLPEEEGILVNFGYDMTGSGPEEPSGATSFPEQYTQPEQGETTPVDIAAEAAVSDPEEAVMTQEFEEAPVVEKKVEQPDPEAERKRQEAIAAEALRQKQLEAERQRLAAEEAERKRIAEEQERQRREAEEQERRRNEIINRTRNALSNSQGAGSGENQGVAGGEGNQGVQTGAVGATNYGEGSGLGNEGLSFDLAGRQARSLPLPKYDSQSEGIVVVEVTVDRDGNVVQATPGVRGSTTLEEYFLRVAREAALTAKFDRKPDAPVIQKGTITYHFILR